MKVPAHHKKSGAAILPGCRLPRPYETIQNWIFCASRYAFASAPCSIASVAIIPVHSYGQLSRVASRPETDHSFDHPTGRQRSDPVRRNPPGPRGMRQRGTARNDDHDADGGDEQKLAQLDTHVEEQ